MPISIGSRPRLPWPSVCPLAATIVRHPSSVSRKFRITGLQPRKVEAGHRQVVGEYDAAFRAVQCQPHAPGLLPARIVLKDEVIEDKPLTGRLADIGREPEAPIVGLILGEEDHAIAGSENPEILPLELLDLGKLKRRADLGHQRVQICPVRHRVTPRPLCRGSCPPAERRSTATVAVARHAAIAARTEPGTAP